MTSEGTVPSGTDVTYDLTSWTVDERVGLDLLLREAGVPVHWRRVNWEVAPADAFTLLVPATQRAVVEDRIAYLRGPARATPHAQVPSTDGEPATLPPQGWFPDPWRQAAWRWWDGHEWTGFASGAPTTARPWFPPRGERGEALGMQGGGIAAAGYVGSIALAVAVGLLVHALGAAPIVTLVMSQAALWACLAGACVIAVRRHGTGSLADLGLRRPDREDIRVGLLSGFGLRAGAIAVGIIIVTLFRDSIGRDTSFARGLHIGGWTAVVLVAIAAVGAPFFEELFFRGLLQAVFTRRLGVRLAIGAQAGCFALVHLWPTMGFGQVLLTVIVIGGVGVYQGALRWRYERLASAMIAHGIFNLTAVLLVLALT
jgi:membrane protease YdiL (CAAX protease family)